jgi:hypothetical protein
LNIGNGTTTSPEGKEWIKIPRDILLKKGNDPKKTIVEIIYPNLRQTYHDQNSWKKEQSYVQETKQSVKSEDKIYRSCETVCKAVTLNEDDDMLYSKEFFKQPKVSWSSKS